MDANTTDYRWPTFSVFFFCKKVVVWVFWLVLRSLRPNLCSCLAHYYITSQLCTYTAFHFIHLCTNKYKIEHGIEEFEQKVLSAYKRRCQYRDRDNPTSKQANIYIHYSVFGDKTRYWKSSTKYSQCNTFYKQTTFVFFTWLSSLLYINNFTFVAVLRRFYV